MLVTDGPAAVRELIELGTNFDHDSAGDLSLTREGGHRRDRIAHAGGDATGAEIQRALNAAVQAAPEIEVVEHALAVDLLLDRRRCGRRPDPPRDGRGPDRRRRRGALPRGGAGQRRARAGLLPDDQPSGRDRRRYGDRAAGGRHGARPRVRAVPPDRHVPRPRLPRPAAADLRGGPRRGCVPRRLRGRPLHAGRPRAGRPRTARRRRQGDHPPHARDRPAAPVARRATPGRGVLGAPGSRRSWPPAAPTASTR